MRQVARLLLVVALAGWTASAQKDEFQWKGRIASGKALEIKGVNGGVRADTATGDEAEVVATKTARRSDPKQVEIKVVEHGDGVTICAVYPTPDGEKPNECNPGSGGRMSTRNNDVQVEFAVRVPAGVRFVGRTVNGKIEASVRGDVEAHTVNGSVTISTRGHAEAKTVNGGITASMGSADGTKALAFETVNGSVTVELPDRANAEVRAETVNGGIETDFPLTVQGRFGPRKVSGTIGGGGRSLSIKTVNGSIRLRKGNVV